MNLPLQEILFSKPQMFTQLFDLGLKKRNPPISRGKVLLLPNANYALAYLAAKSSRDMGLILLALPAVPNWS